MKAGYVHFKVKTNGLLFWAVQIYQFINEKGEKIINTERIEEFDNVDEADSRLYEWKSEFWGKG